MLITENHSFTKGLGTMVESLRKCGDFEINKYSDLLSQTKQYHMDYIVKHEELEALKSKALAS